MQLRLFAAATALFCVICGQSGRSAYACDLPTAERICDPKLRTCSQPLEHPLPGLTANRIRQKCNKEWISCYRSYGCKAG
jgi:hypothetical protein